MTTWYLIIIILSGSDYRSTSSQQTIQFQNQESCTLVRNELKTKYKSETNYIECKKDN